MPERVRITDVSPRDGLQNEQGVIAPQQKVRLIELLSETGVDEVEITSFVSPKWVPQLGDASDVCAGVHDFIEGVNYVAGTLPKSASTENKHAWPVWSALVPNEKGLERAIQIHEGVLPLKIAAFAAASETFSQKNTNGSIEEVMTRIERLIAPAHNAGIREIRGYLSCVIACPFEGPIDPEIVGTWALRLREMGIEEIDLGDTIGAGTPETISAMLNAVQARMAQEGARPTITLHLHDTFGRAADCVRAALDLGIRSFDGSVAGLGGCPFASTPEKRAPGNISTELLVQTIESEGYETGVDLDALARAAEYAREVVTGARTTGTGGAA